MFLLEDLEKKINSELNTKINSSKISSSYILPHIDISEYEIIDLRD